MSAPRPSRPLSAVCLLPLLLLAGAAAPAAAGTLYVPILAPDDPGAGEYATRIWLTNAGSADVTAEALFLRTGSDGTEGRGEPARATIAAGSTLVYTPSGGAGMLELQVPESVAVSAELRNKGLPGPRKVYGAVPVVWSGNAATAGETVVLQGVRRTRQGVRSHLGLLNLGHQEASCRVVLAEPSGRVIVDVPGISVPALSHVVAEDALWLAGESHLGDVQSRVTCDRTFYAYVALAEAGSGEVVFQRPSPTGTSTLEPPEEDGGPAPDTGEQTTVFSRSGVFHVPTRRNPTRIFNIDAPHPAYRKLVVEMTVTPGDWSYEPSKSHSIFWLHRGGCCNPWPKWDQNIVGYVNVWGPKKNQVSITHNLDYVSGNPFDKTVVERGGASMVQGKQHRFRFVYDAEAGILDLTIRRGGKVVASRAGAATTGLVRTPASGRYMIYFGHEDDPHAPERPTFGWKYSDLRVELIP